MSNTYQILWAFSSGDLQVRVQEAIREGKLPVGGVAIIPETDTKFPEFYQAVCEPLSLLPAAKSLQRALKKKK